MEECGLLSCYQAITQLVFLYSPEETSAQDGTAFSGLDLPMLVNNEDYIP